MMRVFRDIGQHLRHPREAGIHAEYALSISALSMALIHAMPEILLHTEHGSADLARSVGIPAGARMT
jgi:hypothetical protein